MDNYIEVKIKNDPEFAKNHVLAALFRKLHRRLIEIESVDIGVSFPEFTKGHLGSVIRIHGKAQSIDRLMKDDWLIGLHDHVVAGPVKEVPAKAKHRIVQRVQAKSNPERLRRRAMKRHGVSAEEAMKRIPDSVEETLDLPYIKMASESSKQSFQVFVRHGEILDTAIEGKFSSYGLSSVSTVPWF